MGVRSLLYAALSGILLTFSLPYFDVPVLAWFGFVPFFIALDGPGPGSGFRAGFVLGCVYFAGALYWLPASIHTYGGIPLSAAILAALLLCMVFSLYYAVFGAVAAHLRRVRPALFFIAAPVVWTALEFARAHLFTGFPWLLIGCSQYRSLPLIQIADLTGIYGVSFLIVLVNASIADAIGGKKTLRPLAIAAACLAAVLIYGYGKLRVPEQSGGLTISLVQANVEQHRKWDPAYRDEVVSAYRRLTQDALSSHPDLVIWPETSTPFYFNGPDNDSRKLSGELALFVQHQRVPLLFGSPTCSRLPSRRIIAWNSALLLAADGRPLAEYRKMHLVPFGEYAPFKGMPFFSEKLVQGAGDFEPGTEYTVMKLPARTAGQADTAFGAVICYEIIFPDLVRRFVANGASLIATITNDGWFGKTAAPYQHFAAAVFRAVENRVPVARAANTGISGFIDSRGRILAATDIFKEAQVTASVRPGTEKTFYTRYGDMFAYGCALVALVMILARKKLKAARQPRMNTDKHR
ncbi:MAG TPA: apolipoprotein N-acyltransferase [Nitrospirota bacterium]|nr:apolipoprotein N-acyltransferase [Nitrospirota bacterium]